ncbi:MAG: sensory rhodopsin transducer [Bacillota bacterium]
MEKYCGSKIWFIPDGYYPESSSGKFPSHEAICVLNPGKEPAEIEITLYFEDRPKMEGFTARCQAERTNHIRMDRLRDREGRGVPIGVPYAIMVRSDNPIIAQYSRMDTRQAEMALMTTIAFPINE